jgi:hypothetical protein
VAQLYLKPYHEEDEEISDKELKNINHIHVFHMMSSKKIYFPTRTFLFHPIGFHLCP